MKSLRTRFFLLSWPLVVAAIAAVAFGVERWTVVELERFDAGPAPTRDRARDEAWADTLASSWRTLRDADGGALLRRLVAGAEPPAALVALDTAGVVLARSDTTITLVAVPPRLGGVVRFRRRTTVAGGGQADELIALSGLAVRDSEGNALGGLYVLPVPPQRDVPPASARRAALRRRIWSVALAAGVASAAAALLLAGPLVARVRRLADAAAAIRGGALDTRVGDTSSDELGALGRSFDAMAESLAQAQRHQRNLVTDVAHELRTPLTNVIGLVEAMQDGLQPADERTLAALRGEVGLLAALVHELQELSLAESGQMTFDLAPVDAAAAACDALDAVRASADGRTLVGPAPGPPVLVRADARRLAQVLRNLLRNAVTHTPVGGRIEVHVEPRGDRVAMIVTDTGRGIPAEHLPLVFERFHRVDPSRDRASGGMGLGLAVVRQLVSAMEGRVWAESEIGHGSRFGLELPAVSTSAEANGAKT